MFLLTFMIPENHKEVWICLICQVYSVQEWDSNLRQWHLYFHFIQAASLAHLTHQNVSIFASISHADLEGHLPKMALLDWRILAPKSIRTKDEGEPVKPVSIAAVNLCHCGCETMAVADSDGQVSFVFTWRQKKEICTFCTWKVERKLFPKFLIFKPFTLIERSKR